MSTNNLLTIAFTVILLASLLTLTVTPANVQATSKPTVPQFTVHQVSDKIEVAIKNQPFTSYTNTSGYLINLYYTIEVKWHSDESWRPLKTYLDQSNTANTLWSIPVTYFSEYTETTVSISNTEYVDFRVKAVTAYDDSHVDPASIYGINRPGYYVKFDEVTSSDWSGIQTIAIYGGSSSSPQPSQTTNVSIAPPSDSNNPQQQKPISFYLIIILATVCIIIIPMAIVTQLSKHKILPLRQTRLSSKDNGGLSK